MINAYFSYKDIDWGLVENSLYRLTTQSHWKRTFFSISDLTFMGRDIAWCEDTRKVNYTKRVLTYLNTGIKYRQYKSQLETKDDVFAFFRTRYVSSSFTTMVKILRGLPKTCNFTRQQILWISECYNIWKGKRAAKWMA